MNAHDFTDIGALLLKGSLIAALPEQARGTWKTRGRIARDRVDD